MRSGEDVLERLSQVLQARKQADPKRSYVAGLYAKGLDGMLKKIGEEATEVVMAAKDGVPARITSEVADLWFHCLVMLTYLDIQPGRVLALLEERFGVSGLEEKTRRDGFE